MAHHDDTDDGLGAALVKGAVAGVAASAALDWFMWNNLSPETRQRTRRVRPDGLDPGHVIARKAARAMGTDIQPRGRNNQHPAGVAVHFAIGMAPTLVYTALRDRAPSLTMSGGTLFGLGLFIMQDETMNTVTGLGARPGEYPWAGPCARPDRASGLWRGTGRHDAAAGRPPKRRRRRH
ncbi:MAG TPA: hypothetical protein PLL33_12930 [Paracoccus sp. (in: a-proteobacteria)]|nr:hypothetical protein [Paracoccus sp. (in: a-proteobacteria)]